MVREGIFSPTVAEFPGKCYWKNMLCPNIEYLNIQFTIISSHWNCQRMNPTGWQTASTVNPYFPGFRVQLYTDHFNHRSFHFRGAGVAGAPGAFFFFFCLLYTSQLFLYGWCSVSPIILVVSPSQWLHQNHILKPNFIKIITYHSLGWFSFSSKSSQSLAKSSCESFGH